MLSKVHNNLKKINIVSFGINLSYYKNKNGDYKKSLKPPLSWQLLKNDTVNVDKMHNALAILTGKESQLIVIDIDKEEDWQLLLKNNNQIEPNTVKVK